MKSSKYKPPKNPVKDREHFNEWIKSCPCDYYFNIRDMGVGDATSSLVVFEYDKKP